MARCVVLFSGGLDSTLALAMMVRQGVETIAFYADNCFHGGDPEAHRQHLGDRAMALGAKDFVVRDLTDPLVELVKHPRYGRGRNMNPCLDCRIRTLAEGARIREEYGLDFVATGEVRGQRPMSQRREAMRLVDRHAADMGLDGLLLRPLCARLLDPTLPETNGWVDREQLGAMQGRGRQPQLALAAEYGITDYPSPAGGCLLTDPGYALRLRDLNEQQPDWTAHDAELLKIGRHFRPAPGWRIVASRRAEENEKMKTALPPGARVFVTDGRPGAMVALMHEAASDGGDRTEAEAAPDDVHVADESHATREALEQTAAGLAVYYSKFRAEGRADVANWTQGVADSRAVRAEVSMVDPATLRSQYIGTWQGDGAAPVRPSGGE